MRAGVLLAFLVTTLGIPLPVTRATTDGEAVPDGSASCSRIPGKTCGCSPTLRKQGLCCCRSSKPVVAESTVAEVVSASGDDLRQLLLSDSALCGPSSRPAAAKKASPNRSCCASRTAKAKAEHSPARATAAPRTVAMNTDECFVSCCPCSPEPSPGFVTGEPRWVAPEISLVCWPDGGTVLEILSDTETGEPLPPLVPPPKSSRLAV